MNFLQNKYSKWYFNIISSARKQLRNGYTERHHVIPKAIGGPDEKANIVHLTARAHFICHLLLTKMLTGNDRIKMLHAGTNLVHRRTKRMGVIKVNARLYEMLKKQRADALRNIPQSEETKRKISRSKLGHVQSDETKLKISIANSGRLHTIEAKEKIAASLTKYYENNEVSEEIRKKIGDVHRGKTLSDEMKRLIGYASSQKSMSDESKKQISASLIEYYSTNEVSEETRKKIGDVHRGKKVSDETKRAIGAASKGRNTATTIWVLLDPNGEIHESLGLQNFCRMMNVTSTKSLARTFQTKTPVRNGALAGWMVIEKREITV